MCSSPEVQPPQRDNFPQENTGDLSVPLPEEPGLSDQPATSVPLLEQPGLSDQSVTSAPLPEQPGLLDQPVTGHMSASEASQKSNTEKDIDPGKVYNFSLQSRHVL